MKAIQRNQQNPLVGLIGASIPRQNILEKFIEHPERESYHDGIDLWREIGWASSVSIQITEISIMGLKNKSTIEH